MTAHSDSQHEKLPSLSASQRIQLGELIDQYELALDAGEALSLETLCDESPELLPYLITSLRQLRVFDARLSTIPTLPIPEQIGEFSVIETLGAGSTGIVFRCRQQNPDRHVAVKVLKPLLDVDEQQNRFRREMAAVSAIDETGMAEVYQTGIVEWCGVRCLWIALELLSGGSVCEYIRKNQLAEATRLNLFRTICLTLRAAHRKGILHRDLKPSNILMSEDGRPHLVDFGVAKLPVTFDEIQQTETGVPAQRGTAAWMAPELLLADQPLSGDVRSEIFSLGVVLFEMISGQHPFAAERLSVAQVSARIVQRDLVRLEQAVPDVCPDLSAFASKMMAFEANLRYQNMDEVLSDLTLLEIGEPVKARLVPFRERTVRWCQRHWKSLLTAVVSLSAVVGVAITIVMTSQQLRKQSELLANVNEQLREKSDHLQQRTADLEKSLHLRDRSIRNGNLRSLQYVVSNSPTEVYDRLHDVTAFPVDSRGFAWRLLNSEAEIRELHLANTGGAVGQISFDLSGRYLMATSSPQNLVVYDRLNGSRRVSSFAVDPSSSLIALRNGTTALAVSADQLLVEFRLSDAEPIRTFAHTQGMSGRFSVSEDERWIVGLTAEQSPFIADLDSGSIRLINAVIQKKPAGFWFSDTDTAVNCFEGKAGWRKWSTETLQLLSQKTPDNQSPTSFRANSVDVSVDGSGARMVAAGSTNGHVYLANADDPSNGRILRLANDDNRLMVKLLSSSQLITAGARLQIHDIHKNQPPLSLPTPPFLASAIAVSADSRYLAVGLDSGDVSIVDLQRPSVLRREIGAFRDLPDPGFGFPRAFCACGHVGQILVGHSGGWVAKIDLKTGQSLEAFPVCSGAINTIVADSVRGWVAFGIAGKEKAITVLRLSDDMRCCPTDDTLLHQQPAALACLPMSGDVRKLALTGDKLRLLAALRNGSVVVLDCGTWTILRQWKHHEGGIFGMDVHGDLCVTGGTDGTLQLTQLTDGTVQQKWNAHSKRITSVLIPRNGDTLFSASQDGEIRQWDFGGRLQRSLIAHVGPVTCLQLSPDGSTLFSGGQDHRILIWDAVTGDLQREITAHQDHLSDLIFVPSKDGLLSSGLDSAMRFWGPASEPKGDAP